MTLISTALTNRRRAKAAPDVVIATPLLPNQARETWREWLHLSVENVRAQGSPETRSVDARVFVQLDDEPERPLFWSVAYRGELRTTLDAGVAVPVPIAIRDSRPGPAVYNNTLVPGIAYLTDWQFVQRAPRTLLPKRYRLRVRVQYDQGTERAADFYLSISADPHVPLALTRAVRD